ncbi:hypothetical protein GWI33_019423 [Rhynchophorus ferrugineus]|uniref:Uncharacterized protein n=1 Tax=Rhynchophorus ferrugineus TaxID=354439 RepID=A0A834HRR9_RHYFE|nr:hypothetical protein GWI33_019423 [Rhynchophorus ferrugineus]
MNEQAAAAPKLVLEKCYDFLISSDEERRKDNAPVPPGTRVPCPRPEIQLDGKFQERDDVSIGGFIDFGVETLLLMARNCT